MQTSLGVTAKLSWGTRLSVDFALVSPVLGEYLSYAVGNVPGTAVGLAGGILAWIAAWLSPRVSLGWRVGWTILAPFAFLIYAAILGVLLAEVGEAVTGEEGFSAYMLRFRY